MATLLADDDEILVSDARVPDTQPMIAGIFDDAESLIEFIRHKSKELSPLIVLCFVGVGPAPGDPDLGRLERLRLPQGRVRTRDGRLGQSDRIPKRYRPGGLSMKPRTGPVAFTRKLLWVFLTQSNCDFVEGRQAFLLYENGY
ncbi:MAG: hypothetical protein ACYCOU_10115 [Sulfobacillus sp.]